LKLSTGAKLREWGVSETIVENTASVAKAKTGNRVERMIYAEDELSWRDLAEHATSTTFYHL
jgi:hypothetical protein